MHLGYEIRVHVCVCLYCGQNEGRWLKGEPKPQDWGQWSVPLTPPHPTPPPLKELRRGRSGRQQQKPKLWLVQPFQSRCLADGRWRSRLIQTSLSVSERTFGNQRGQLVCVRSALFLTCYTLALQQEDVARLLVVHDALCLRTSPNLSTGSKSSVQYKLECYSECDGMKSGIVN